MCGWSEFLPEWTRKASKCFLKELKRAWRDEDCCCKVGLHSSRLWPTLQQVRSFEFLCLELESLALLFLSSDGLRSLTNLLSPVVINQYYILQSAQWSLLKDRWQAKLDKELDEEEADWDEEQRFWELMMFTGSLAIASLGRLTRKRKHSRSRPGRSENVERCREKDSEDIWNYHFSSTLTYDELKFRRRFKMSSSLFNKIIVDVYTHDTYFCLKVDAPGKVGLSPHQKLTATLRQLAYGIGVDALDEYCRIGESTTLESLYHFVKVIRELYKGQYLRKPTADDFQNHLQLNAE